MRDKIKKIEALQIILARSRRQDKRIVFTNGCFDILHVGHVTYLAKAKKLGDLLVVGLNSDNSVRRLKGRSRPINNESDRAEVLSGLSSVDYVVIFKEDTPEDLIRRIVPDVLAKGGDWRPGDIAGGKFVKSRGGKVVIIPFVRGYSTTATVTKTGK